MKSILRFFVPFLAASVAAFAADTTRPEITGAFVAPNGTTMTFQFSEPVVIGSGGSDGFRVVPSGDGAATLSYASGSGTRVLVYTLSRTILAGEDLRLFYNQPDDGVEDLAGNDLAHQSVYRRRAGLPMQHAPMVNNNSTQVAPETTAPTLSSATIGADGETLTLAFSEAVWGPGGAGGLTLSMSTGAPIPTYASGNGSDTRVYTLSSIVTSSTTGTISYAPPAIGIEDGAGNDLASFSGVPIVNNSTQIGGGGGYVTALTPEASTTSTNIESTFTTGTKVVLPAGTLTELGAYVHLKNAASPTLKLALLNSSFGLVANGQVVVTEAGAWANVTGLSTVIPAGTYYIVAVTSDYDGAIVTRSAVGVTGDGVHDFDVNYAAFPTGLAGLEFNTALRSHRAKVE